MKMPSSRCSIIIPVLNDGQVLAGLLESLQSLRTQGHEILVVDGGSDDNPQVLCEGRVDKFLKSPKGRARQMNYAAMNASGDVLWFVHADTSLDAQVCMQTVLSLMVSDRVWGRFDVRLSGNDWRLRVVEKMMNLRSRLTGIATGDQGIFIRRDAFEQLQGFPDIALMEDVAMSRLLKRLSAPLVSSETITTSSRRWETQGVCKTILLMWTLRLGYALGLSPERLEKYYKSCSFPMQK